VIRAEQLGHGEPGDDAADFPELDECLAKDFLTNPLHDQALGPGAVAVSAWINGSRSPAPRRPPFWRFSRARVRRESAPESRF
jgi:hypothetical protein